MSFGKLKDDSEKSITMGLVSGRPGSLSGGNVDAFLGKGSRVVGVLAFSGPVELDGDIEGEVHSKDRLIIGEGAVLKAKIQGAEIIVKGAITGDITATKSLILKKPARIIGNITAASLSIEEGVIFEGKCTMGSGGVSAGGPKTDQRPNPEKTGVPA